MVNRNNVDLVLVHCGARSFQTTGASRGKYLQLRFEVATKTDTSDNDGDEGDESIRKSKKAITSAT